MAGVGRKGKEKEKRVAGCRLLEEIGGQSPPYRLPPKACRDVLSAFIRVHRRLVISCQFPVDGSQLRIRVHPRC